LGAPGVVLYIACCICVSSLFRGSANGEIEKNVHLILSSIIFIAAYHLKLDFNPYTYSYSWIPLFLLLLGMTTLSIIYCNRNFGSPKDVQYFKGRNALVSDTPGAWFNGGSFHE
jgi:hypothetical protein